MEINERFSGLDWVDTYTKLITVVGVGGIGSWASILLARAGFNICIIDNDIIEQHNIGGQLYKYKDINRFKVEAISDIISDFAPNSDYLIEKNLYNHFFVSNIMISAVDNLETRKEMFEDWIKKYRLLDDTNIPYLFIDGRMLAETYQIYIVDITNKLQIDSYLKSLVMAEDKKEATCSTQQTSHIGAKLGAEIVEAVSNYLSNFKNGHKFRKLPFFKQYDVISSNYVKIEFVDDENGK